jgi:hypothetical protein
MDKTELPSCYQGAQRRGTVPQTTPQTLLYHTGYLFVSHIVQYHQCILKLTQENQTTMSRIYRVPRTTNTTRSDGGEGAPGLQSGVNVIALIVASSCVLLLCAIFVFFARYIEKTAALQQAEQDAESQDTTSSEEEMKRKRKESISNGLHVKEWVPDDPPAKSTEGDQDTPPSGEAVEAPAPQTQEAPPINSSPTSCVMGSDDCESVVGGEEMAGCAICLSHFKPQQLVCESTNSSCQHVFHKDCMVDWLMLKHHDTCPMCREIYLLITV